MTLSLLGVQNLLFFFLLVRFSRRLGRLVPFFRRGDDLRSFRGKERAFFLDGQCLERLRRALLLASVALIGMYDGFFGPGTGSFLMILFVRVLGYDFLHAAASARAVNVATNAAALVWFLPRGEWLPAIALGIGWIAARDPDAVMLVLPVVADGVQTMKLASAISRASSFSSAMWRLRTRISARPFSRSHPPNWRATF